MRQHSENPQSTVVRLNLKELTVFAMRQLEFVVRHVVSFQDSIGRLDWKAIQSQMVTALRVVVSCLVFCATTLALAQESTQSDDSRNENAASEPDAGQATKALFNAKCATCHGEQGEGAGNNRRRLEGDLSAAQLAKVIAETMPEDDPGSLKLVEAQSLTAYIYEQFYSPVARERNKPPRIDVSRLTARQYRQVTADLIASFRPVSNVANVSNGLRGEYHAGRRLAGWKKRAGDRIDPRIAFQFGTESPIPEITEPHEFSIRWEGALTAPETGEYDFVIRTEHSARFWLNNNQIPLIDAWVKSGSDTEYRGSIFLIAGRQYSLKLEYTKAKQGVDDSKNQKEKPASKPSSISLCWKRPSVGLIEVVPARALSTGEVPESFVCTTPFPPDDRSYGWERGNAVSKTWDQATTAAAIELADYATRRLNELAGTKDDAPDRTDKLRLFCVQFAERAFRRPLSPDQKTVLVERSFENVTDPEIAVRKALVRTLKFPQFLYRELGESISPIEEQKKSLPLGTGDENSDSTITTNAATKTGAGADPSIAGEAFTTASRLAFALWDSVPDETLWKAAERGELVTYEQRLGQAERMLADPRAKQKLREFLATWLRIDQPAELEKDKALYPEFDAQVASDLRVSLELFLERAVANDEPGLAMLLNSQELHLNSRLARFYGTTLDGESIPDDEFRIVPRVGDGRSGVITHPYVMSRLARTNESSPIHRGVFLARGVLGRLLKPPPEAVTPLPIEVHPNLSTRDRVTLQTEPRACATCHAVINPLGFTLENFDAVGRFRADEKGQPVNAAGGYVVRTGKHTTINGSEELGRFLSTSDEVSRAFVQQMFHHLIQQPTAAFGSTTLDRLQAQFTDDRFHLRRLAAEIAVVAATPRAPASQVAKGP